MSTSWKLFKVFRRDLWVYIGAEVGIVFLFSVNTIYPQNPKSVLESFGILSLLAAFLSQCLRIPSRLNAMPFPVSVRQQVRLSVWAFSALWGCGFFALLLAVGTFEVPPEQWASMLLMMLQRFPFYVLGFLLVYRQWQLNSHMVSLCLLLIFLPHAIEGYDKNFWSSSYFLALPAACGMIVFYWFEIPRQLVGRDRLLSAQGNNQPVSWMRDLGIAPRQTLITCIGNTIDGVLVLSVAFLFIKIFYNLGRVSTFSVQTLISMPWLCIVLLTYIHLAFLLSREVFRRVVCSGFGLHASVWMTLMQMTFVLGPLVEALGVKKGVEARCDQCRHSKFIWSLRCPHCGFSGPGKIKNKQTARFARGDTARITIRQKFIFRLFVPFQLFLCLGLASVAADRPFEDHTVLLKFQDAQVAEQAAQHIEDWIQAHAETSTWLTSNEVTSQIPQKYRLQVVYYQGNEYMTCEAYGLRWDSVAKLPAILAESLGEDGRLPEACSFTTRPMESREANCLFWKTRTYLDNRLHWVARDNPTAQKNRKNLPTPLPKQVE